MTRAWMGLAVLPLSMVMAAPASAGELLVTTMDDVSSVLNPLVGTGVGASISSMPADDFVAGHAGDGLVFDAIGENVLYQQTDGVTNNVDLHRGTVTLWYMPYYNSTDPQKTTIFGTGQWTTPGSLHIGKHNPSNDNDIFVIHFDDNGNFNQNNVRNVDFSWSANEWVHLRLTWDFTVAPGEANYHLYLDDIELPFSATANGPGTTGPFDMGSESQNNHLYIGARDYAGSIIPLGVHDEVVIYDEPLPPGAEPEPATTSTTTGAGGDPSGGSGGGATTSSGSGGEASSSGSGNTGGATSTSGGSDNDADNSDGAASSASGCAFDGPSDDGRGQWLLLALALAAIRRPRREQQPI